MTPSGTGYALPLAAAGGSSRALVGGKAAGLAWLIGLGCAVPDGFVLTTAAYRAAAAPHRDGMLPPEVGDELHRAAAALGEGPLAVRSSAVTEDDRVWSGAGVYATVLGVLGADALEAAVRRCWASTESQAARAYRARHGIADPALAVVVQRDVAAEVTGVVLTVDPVTGDDVALVSAAAGGGERLMAGEVDEEWRIAGDRAERSRGGPLLTSAEALAVAGAARRLAAAAGGPQDVEWALAEGRLWLLQARSMTAVPPSVSWEPPLPGGWLRNFRLGEWLPEPVSPLFGTWFIERVEARVRTLARRDAGIAMRPPLHVLVHGWYFHAPLGTSSPAAMAAALWRRPRFLLAAVAASGRPEWTDRLFVRRCVDDWSRRVLPRYRAEVARLEDALAGGSPPEELVALVDRGADALGDCLWSLSLVGGSAWKAEVVLARVLRRWVPGLAAGHQPLLCGLRAPRMRPQAVVSLDWVHPPLGEFGAPEGTTPAARTALTREETEATVVAALSGRRLRRFRRLLSLARRYAVLREEQAELLPLAIPPLRRAVLRVGAVLADRGVVTIPDDVFFLTWEQMQAGLSGVPVPEVGAARRRWEQQRRLAPPLTVGRLPRFFAGMLGPRLDVLRTPADGDGIIGLPGSPGRATGPVRVLEDPFEPERLLPGEVLVARLVTAAWLPLLERTAAVVTDGGHVAAHASLLVRELGLPAVLATGDATARLRDGELVTVDGGAGVVTLYRAGVKPGGDER